MFVETEIQILVSKPVWGLETLTLLENKSRWCSASQLFFWPITCLRLLPIFVNWCIICGDPWKLRIMFLLFLLHIRYDLLVRSPVFRRWRNILKQTDRQTRLNALPTPAAMPASVIRGTFFKPQYSGISFGVNPNQMSSQPYTVWPRGLSFKQNKP